MSSPFTSTADAPELTAKKTFRLVWECGQKIEAGNRAAKHTIDTFNPELKSLRTKLREQCSRILLLKGSSCSLKAEELLWKRGFYDVIQRCKQRKEALDGESPLWKCYSQHLSDAVRFYDCLLYNLSQEFGVEAPQLSAMKDGTLGRLGIQWLKDVMYKCFIHLGDLARYQVPLGVSTRMAVAYYHRAITLDPTNGTAFNQLAVLVGGRNENLDSIYYYQRSIVSPLPFSGSEANMMRLFEKNQQALDHYQSRQMRAKDSDLRGAAKKLLFLQFIQLQCALHPGSKSSSSENKFLSTLCQETLDSFKQCLEYDLQTFKEDSDSRISRILSAEGPDTASTTNEILLPPDVLLKLTALSILPSHSLRVLGSTLTQVATAFALSIFSTLLSHSYQRIVQIVVSAVNANHKNSESEGVATSGPSEAEVVDSLEHGKSIVSILLEYGISAVAPQPVGVRTESKEGSAVTKADDKPAAPLGGSMVKEKKRKVVDRRRRGGGGREMKGEEEEEEGDSGSDSDGSISGSSDGSLSVLSEDLGEDDLELLDSLSDSSSSEPEEEKEGEGKKEGKEKEGIEVVGGTTSADVSATGLLPEPVKKTGKRRIVLAANFTMPPSSPGSKPKSDNVVDRGEVKSHTGLPTPLLPSPSVDWLPKSDSQLVELMQSTDVQGSVYTACCLVAEESSLMALRVFVYWLQSYPIIIATCTQSSATMWSRIASLINVLPTRQEIMSSSIAGPVIGDANLPLLEDLLLREFPPIVPALQAMQYGVEETLSKIQETSFRICSLQSFGHFLADARTAPSFTYNDATEKFEGPDQKALKERDMAKATQEQERKQAEVTRSKLMKAMAQRRLQSEIQSLSEATSKTEGSVFTPYLIPDANSLCSGLHIVKKLVKTEKFVFVIAKAVIESLDGMKKSRESYAAREAIKFLEKEFHSGNKFIQAQKVSESLTPGKKKPVKMEIQDWLLECLVDCACYFNQTYTQQGQSHAVATLIVEKRILDIFNDAAKQSENPHMTEVLMVAQQNGVDLETMIGFHINWSKNSKKRSPRK